MLVTTFANRLNEAMRARGQQPIDVVRGTGLSKARVSHYCTGKREPNKNTMLLLAEYLGVDYAWLIGMDGPMVVEKAAPSATAELDSLRALVDAQQRTIDAQADTIRSVFKGGQSGGAAACG